MELRIQQDAASHRCRTHTHTHEPPRRLTATREELYEEPHRTPRLPIVASEVPYTEVMMEVSVGHTVATPKAEAADDTASGAMLPAKVRVAWVAVEWPNVGGQGGGGDVSGCQVCTHVCVVWAPRDSCLGQTVPVGGCLMCCDLTGRIRRKTTAKSMPLAWVGPDEFTNTAHLMGAITPMGVAGLCA